MITYKCLAVIGNTAFKFKDEAAFNHWYSDDTKQLMKNVWLFTDEEIDNPKIFNYPSEEKLTEAMQLINEGTIRD